MCVSLNKQLHASLNFVYLYEYTLCSIFQRGSFHKHSADLHVPAHYKNYYKFWWSEELSCLKENAIQSNEIWKAAGRPRTGPIADKRNADSDGKKVVKLNYFFN